MAVTPHPHGGGELPIPWDEVLRVLAYAILGVAYAVSGYWKKREQGYRDDGEPASFSPKRFFRTVLIGAVAGVIVAWQGEEFTGPTVEIAMAAAVPVVDQLLNRERAKRDQMHAVRQNQQ